MNIVLDELSLGFQQPDHLIRVVVRLVIATLLGAVIGYERAKEHKEAGVRTHMLVALAAGLYTVVHLEPGGVRSADMSRVIQGIATGIGFLGAGCILKLSEQHQVKGLNTAASIWLTAAAGMAVGAGWLWPALAGVVLAWAVLYELRDWEHRMRQREEPPTAPNPDEMAPH
jgi:putative Mg2+ transporter-C (MgtC) family protein